MSHETPGHPAAEFAGVRTAFAGETVLDDINFRVEEGEFVCLLGPSGCGKSTTLRLLGGLLRPDSGRIRVAGLSPEEAWSELAYVFQQPRLLPWRNVLSNVMLGMELRGSTADRATRRQQAMKQLELAGLGSDLRKYPGALSGGERQRVSIARALALDPRIILMDEPLSALDVSTRKRLRGEIHALWARTGKTVLFVTHDMDDALALADRVLIFSGKPTRIVSEMTLPAQRPRDLDHDPALHKLRLRMRAALGLGEAAVDDEGGHDGDSTADDHGAPNGDTTADKE
ncbi:ABC transporter ATP-binding protein [Streptomyces sp. NPDC055105]|uniref:ABC transporter ATP-binding protein n=1 Tax=Streptomyces sp. NPDC055105 TaxID=3365719 RepID=UPI0037D56760